MNVNRQTAAASHRRRNRTQHSSRAAAASQVEPLPVAKPKTTRPLNSWMAFRSFYIKSDFFQGLVQMDISPHMSTIWHEEQSKNKWSILASAYSAIRDKFGKKQAPLDSFLEVTVDAIGILRPDVYFTTYGWNLEVKRTDCATTAVLSSAFNANFSALPSAVRSTDLTDKDIVQLCIERGYCPYFDQEDDNSSHGLLSSVPASAHVMRDMFQRKPVDTFSQLVNIGTTHVFYDHSISPASEACLDDVPATESDFNWTEYINNMYKTQRSDGAHQWACTLSSVFGAEEESIKIDPTHGALVWAETQITDPNFEGWTLPEDFVPEKRDLAGELAGRGLLPWNYNEVRYARGLQLFGDQGHILNDWTYVAPTM